MLERITEVSVSVCYNTAYLIIVEFVQQSPDCDLALVHDDDLACLDDAVCLSVA